MLSYFQSSIVRLCHMFPQGFAGALRMALSACGVVLWLLAIPAQAAQVTLVWDDLQNPSSAVGGYNLYYWQGSATTPVRVNAGKQLTYTLTNLTGGQTYSFAVTAYDVNGGGETAMSNTKGQVSTTLPVGNVAPVATNGVLTTTEDTPKSGTLSATDADGNALTYRVVTPASKGTVTVTNASIGAYTYTPLSNATGTDTFTFRANDGQADSNTATVAVTITAVNDAPVANAQSVTTAMNTPVTIALTGSDGDGNPLTFTIATGPVNGTLSGTPPAVTYTPKANFSGTDSFTFRVSDGTATSAPATVALSITMTNVAPVATNGTLSTTEDTPRSGTLRATDANGNALTYSVVTQGSKGTAVLTNASTGAYTYTPKSNANGTDTFTFRASDGLAQSNLATVTITITPVNDAPVASNGTLTTTENMAANGTLRASDIDGDILTYSIVTNGSKGKVTLTGATTGAYTYTPNPKATGTDTFTFRAKDNTTSSNTATVTVTISPAAMEEVVFAVNAGGPAYTGKDGTVYQADTGFSGGSTYTRSVAIAGTEDDVLYQSERHGNFAYTIPVPNGDYLVTLKFAEIYWTAAGRRLFDVLIEGREVLPDLDLVAKVGPVTAYDVSMPVRVTDGVLNIQFLTNLDNAKVSAIVVETSGQTPPPPPDPEVVFAVNAGGPAYTGKDGTVYQADTGFSGGSTYTSSVAIAGTEDDVLYQSERFGNFAYTIPVPNGDYLVTLKFAEIYWTAAGRRLFDVLIEGREVLPDLDLVAKVGPMTAYDVSMPVRVTDGVLNIQFSSNLDNAKVSAIVVETSGQTP